ncbi:hypothetical protein tb265_04200 [Gemmatimonadetes bacterium T265]|nr:hypothetical protein tb265_04200 [Gemmatimonadetes bacterium T265]
MTRGRKARAWTAACLTAITATAITAAGQGASRRAEHDGPAAPADFLHAHDGQIVDGAGRAVVLRGMGLGGWMLQEGYMLNAGGLTQHVMRRKMAELIGPVATEQFYAAWLDNFVTKADIDALAAWGFNSVRLPMHYELLTPSVEDEPVQGRNTWKEAGFRRIDTLLAWCKANNMYLILDLHAAPGGQGTDLPIADRDPAKPSLWESSANQDKMVALWAEIARRYKDEPHVAGYDLLNEPNWDLDGSGNEHGCKVKEQAPLVALYKRTAAAIRQVDPNHLLIIEGNCWGNNYAGVVPDWDANMALSFHRYWVRPGQGAIRDVLALRTRTGLPVWLGESGENSNDWFAGMVATVEADGIGWAWWTLKKFGFSSPLQIRPNPGFQRVTDYWLGKGPRPSPEEARAALMRLATSDVRFEHNERHPDVAYALRQAPGDVSGAPYGEHAVGAAGGRVPAADFDLGRNGVAYFSRTPADYHVSDGGPPARYNPGGAYRNDPVDLARDAGGAPYVRSLGAGEWLRYTVTSPGGAYWLRVRDAAGAPAGVAVAVNGAAVPNGPAGGAVAVTLLPGRNTLVLRSERDGTSLRAIEFESDAGR